MYFDRHASTDRRQMDVISSLISWPGIEDLVPDLIPKTRTSLCHLTSFMIISAEQWTVRSPHWAHTKYPHESPCRLDEFWQRLALTFWKACKSASPGSECGLLDSAHLLSFSPSSCLAASEACKETRGPSRRTRLQSVTSFMFSVLDGLCMSDWFIYRRYKMLVYACR